MDLSSHTIWKIIQMRLTTGHPIPNWTVLKGYLGDTFLIEEITETRLIIDTPNAKNLVCVSWGDFERVCEAWPDYRNGRKQRQEITEKTRYSKYIISIFHWLETER